MTKTGKVSVTTENIFPVIRQWLYEDKDIFVRELVSNCADTIKKHQRLAEMGKADKSDEDYKIRVIWDDDSKIIKFEDNGIGMTEEELDKYINQIAFSGAMDFVTKYQEESTDKTGIIGHFGLGFYSAFMVSDDVTIETKSYIDGEAPCKWHSEDGMEFEISDSDKATRGTVISIKLSEEAQKIFDTGTLRMTLRKYCSFIPADLYFIDLKADRIFAESEERRKKEAEEKGEEFKPGEPVKYAPINNKAPLWIKKPSECTDEEYKTFYHSVFNDTRDPLFWIHLNMDYPFTLQGILYFPKTDNIYQSLEGRIKIYNHQVFVADNIEEIIPDFLFLLQGCLDCSDLPLNVSRSALQQDEYVKKLSGHIIKKVSDKLNDLFKKQREDYESYWSDISVFVKYGMLKENKFYEKVKDILLFKTVDDKYKTVSELISDDKKIIRYTTDPKAQAAYVEISRGQGYEVVVLDEEIDNNFISFFEYNNQEIKFQRVDSELSGEVSDNDTLDKIRTFFKKALSNDKLDIKAMAMGKDQMPALIRESEENRRMQEMRKQYERMLQMNGENAMTSDDLYPDLKELVINTDNPVITKLLAMDSLGTKDEEASRLALHCYDQARLAHGSLDSEGLQRFLKYNSELLNKTIAD